MKINFKIFQIIIFGVALICESYTQKFHSVHKLLYNYCFVYVSQLILLKKNTNQILIFFRSPVFYKKVGKIKLVFLVFFGMRTGESVGEFYLPLTKVLYVILSYIHPFRISLLLFLVSGFLIRKI